MKKILTIFLCGILLLFTGCNQKTSIYTEHQVTTESGNLSTDVPSENRDEPSTDVQTKKIKWSEITEDGVNEGLLFENIDTTTLEAIASELQALVDETIEEERKNPEIVLTAGFPRVFKSERYKKVLDMGENAMKPLYWIIYKSESAGIYEYICAMALYDLSDFNFEWSNSKEFIEKFNCTILENRE